MTKPLPKQCVPCTIGVDPLTEEEIRERLPHLSSEWKVTESPKLERRFATEQFADALALVNDIGRLAEEEGHHPDICFGWGYVKVSLWTHKIKGLHDNDFVLASKIDKIR